jgi:hypothetical protein
MIFTIVNTLYHVVGRIGRATKGEKDLPIELNYQDDINAITGGMNMNQNVNRRLSLLAGFIAFVALSGCASVQPWEKQNLAKPEMTFEGDKLETGYIEHIYSSKEASSGGAGVGGGGCGCN